MNTSLPSLSALRRHFRYVWCAALLLAGTGAARAQAPAQATTLYGLGTATQPIAPNSSLFFPAGAAVGDQGIITFFTANAGGNANPADFPKKVVGVTPGQRLVGIDSRPLTGQLYGLGYDPTIAFDPTNTVKNTQLYTVNVSTGAVTPVGGGVSLDLGQPVNPLFVFNISFDFNPVADQIRVLSSNRNNYRLSPVNGSLIATDTPLAYSGGTPATPGVVTAAYTNSTIGSTSTTLYDLDKANGNILAVQSPPASGTLINNTPALVFNGFDNLTNSLALGLDIANNSTTGYLIQTAVANGSGISPTNVFDVNLATGVVDNKRTVIPTAQSAGFNVFDVAVPIAPPVCDAPTSPAAGSITDTGASITFTANPSATNYTVAVTPAGGTATTQTATGSPVVLTGLTPNTSYTVSIVSNCFAGLLTSSAVSTTFTTTAPTCAAPTGLTATNVTSNSATITFSGNGSATTYTLTTAPATTTQTLPANATSANLVGLTPNTAYTVSIVSNCAGGATAGPATVAFTTAAAPLTDLTVSTTQSISGNYNNVTVTATGNAILNGPLSVTGTFLVQTGGTLQQNCQPLTGSGNFVLEAQANLVICDPAGITSTGTNAGAVLVTGTRTFSPDANYGYSNTVPQAQVTGSGLPSRVLNLAIGSPAGVTLSQAVSVTQVLLLQAGNLITGGQPLTLLSSAAGTAVVVNTGGVVVGTASVQRYITSNLNNGPGYRHYSSPVNGNTVADFATAGFTPVVNSGYNTSPTPPLFPTFPNVFTYDQSRLGLSNTSPEFDKGFQSPNALNDPIIVSAGYTVNINASQLVDFVGTLNNGAVSRTGLARGPQATAGYQFLGNPYPSAIDYNTVLAASSGMEPALYVFKSNGQYTGAYASYNNGVSVNGGTNVLPVAQGFFVRTAAGQTGTVNFTNAARLTTYDNTLFQRTAVDVRPQLALTLRNATAALQAVMYFEQGATAGFDAAYDAHFLAATNGLWLATEAGTETLSIDGRPALTGADAVLPLQVAAATTGAYTLAVDNLANLPTGYHAYLRDALNGTYTDLAATPSVSLQLAANAALGGRYAVVFSTQNLTVLAAAPAKLAQLATVYPNPAHATAALLLPAALRGQQATAVSVVDNLGRTVLTRTLAVGAAETLELPLTGLAAGVYSVQARTAAGLVVKRLVVE
ncbi:DUF4394 domain-containing protein [Hymenobacter ruricola]|uniref:DUF4394 domain-containing protein n=1 Tax=Hymenobacter ruricola TaxID=2791023 RepID=A0ABS0I2D1_9BACT|nr:DUF4394 domain-containing protein [Hymenobacter ruricola]MBF9221062.1 DUF4394 domain-containing protein [Hymenobacter ruricola]